MMGGWGSQFPQKGALFQVSEFITIRVEFNEVPEEFSDLSSHSLRCHMLPGVVFFTRVCLSPHI